MEEIRKLKAELEAGIRRLLWDFTTKTGLYFKEVGLVQEARMGERYTQVMDVKVKTELDRSGEGDVKDLKVEGFGDFTIVRDHPGYIDIRYKGESVKGVVRAAVDGFPGSDGYAVLKLEIMENVPLMTAKKEGLLGNEPQTPDNHIG